MTSPLSLTVHLLRRNWLLPGSGLVVAALGGVLLSADDRRSSFGLVPLGMGLVLAVVAALRDSYPRSRPAALVATPDALVLDGRTVEASEVTEAKMVPKHGVGSDTVAVLTLRDRTHLRLWMTRAQAEALIALLGASAGEARASFRLALRYSHRFAVAFVGLGVPWLAFVFVSARGSDVGFAMISACIVAMLVCSLVGAMLGLVKGRLQIGADGFSTQWFWRRRFTRFADVESVERPESLRRGVEPDTLVTLTSARRLRLLAPDEPDDDSGRGIEARALFEHIAAAFQRFRRRGVDEVELRVMLAREGRSDEAWLTDLDRLLRGGGARYRIATIEPAQIAAVVRDPLSPPECRIAGATALVRFDPAYRPMVRRAADACAQAQLQATLEAVSEAQGDPAIRAVLRRHSH